MNKFTILGIVLILAAGGLGFVGGMKYGQSRDTSSFQGQFRQRFGNSGNTSMRPVRGQIISADDKSITIKLQDGSTKIVLIPSSANILKTDKASISDLKKEEMVVVFGTQNSDGSVTAQDVQLNPRTVLGSPQPKK